MKLLFLISSPDRSETWLLRELAQRHEVDVLCDPAAGSRREIEEAGATVIGLPMRHRFDVGAIRFLHKRLREHRYDLIHVFFKRALGNLIPAARGLTTPIIAYRGVVGSLHRWDPGAWLTFLNPRIRRIVCVCEAVRQSLRKARIPDRKLTTIYKGHDPAWYDAMPPVHPRSVGVPDGSFVVTCVGTLRRRKGVDMLIRALRLIPDESVHLLLVGDIADSNIPPLIRKLGLEARVHLAGHRPDAAALTGQSDLFVLPSLRREGLPRAVMEAMSQRVPPVVTSAGGQPELVVHGVSGLVVPPGSPAALAEAIALLRGDPARRRALGEAARERIRRDFTIRATLERHEALYAEVLAELGAATSPRR